MKLSRRHALAFAVCTGATLAAGTAVGAGLSEQADHHRRVAIRPAATPTRWRACTPKSSPRGSASRCSSTTGPAPAARAANASVAKAAPDGYTLLFVPSTFAIAQHTLKLERRAPPTTW